MIPCLQEKKNSNDIIFLIRNHKSQNKVAQYSSSAKRKELTTSHFILGKIKYFSSMKEKSSHSQMGDKKKKLR